MKLKSKLLSYVMALSLLGASPAMAGGGTSAWAGTVVGAVGTIYSLVMALYNGGSVVWMNAYGVTINTDPVQLVEETVILRELKKVREKWDPEPKDTYERAAADNGAYEQMEFVPENGLKQPLNFQVAALKNVGIEALGIGPDLASIIGARTSILGGLEYFQPKPSTSTNSEAAEAGTCAAPYSICKKSLTTAQRTAISTAQEKNKQWYGTAGIAHAELGLRAIQQAVVNDESALKEVEVDPSNPSGSNVVMPSLSTTTGKNMKVQVLTSLIGQGKNTYNAMKIVAMMNLELAQRLNEGNMLQGSTLTIEAARAFPKTIDILN